MDRFSKSYDTLVLSGGGIYGYAILGALQYLKDHDRLSKINTFVGTSIGSIIAYLLAIGCTPMEIILYLHSKNVLKNINQFNIISMIQGNGSCDYNTIQSHVEKITIDKVGKYLTLQGLREKFGKTLIVCTYNLTQDCVQYITPDNNPDMPCLVAIRMSSNIPLIFEDFKYMGDYYIDGGISDNFPIEIPELADKNIIGVGFNNTKKKYIKPTAEGNILDYIFHIMFIPLGKLNSDKLERLSDKNHLIIKINLKDDLHSFNFAISHRNTLDLFSTGYNDTKKFFEE